MQLEFFETPEVDSSNKYTKKIMAPQYIPSEVKPRVEELCGITKYSELIRDINTSKVSDEEKQFLRLAATRHLTFNYAKIADYYAHATPEMQRLMEQSALVIIDFDDAIAKGYVKLSTTIKDIVEGSKDVEG